MTARATDVPGTESVAAAASVTGAASATGSPRKSYASFYRYLLLGLLELAIAVFFAVYASSDRGRPILYVLAGVLVVLAALVFVGAAQAFRVARSSRRSVSAD